MESRVEDPWAVEEWDFPVTATPAEQLRFLLNYAVLAPSSHNSQPWRFKIAGNEVDLLADRTRGLPVVDPADRELVISCGAALFHLRTAIRHFGFEDVVHTFPDLDDPDFLAYVRLGDRREPTIEEHGLFAAIKRRHTNRKPFAANAVSQNDLELLVRAAESEDACVRPIVDASEKHHLASLIADGDRIQAQDEQFRRELSSWLAPNRTDRRDGMPGYAMGLGDLASYVGPFLVRTFDWGDGQAAKDRELAEGSPALLVLGTSMDNSAAWLCAGQALDRLLLTAAAHGMSISFLNQPVEVPSLRGTLQELLPGQFPQIVMRVGRGPSVRPTPRRPVHQVLSRSRRI